MRLGFTSCSVFRLDLLIDDDQTSNPRFSCLCSCSWLIRRVDAKSKSSLENDQECLFDPMEHWDVR
ncbi:hypothetical protein PanWU01x14_083400 [Parasponia andersonii]|uniref:Uncharacterized protein n=1 Tax=Parasponia andersonii TaxID=3476 RepID=A0A2P5DA47_PARAD|nr:hypothetical protein PanWU01x14_083400 [Parasponia andersonii]